MVNSNDDTCSSRSKISPDTYINELNVNVQRTSEWIQECDIITSVESEADFSQLPKVGETEIPINNYINPNHDGETVIGTFDIDAQLRSKSVKLSLDTQLNLIRLSKHQAYNCKVNDKPIEQSNYVGNDKNSLPPVQSPPYRPNRSKKKPWKKGVCLIVGDSTLNGLTENRMSSNGTIIVRPFPGAIVGDFYNYLEPLMEKLPSKLIIHAGTNDATSKSATDIVNELLLLKSYIAERFNIDVCISCPTTRVDNAYAKNTVNEICSQLNQVKDINVICNKNIDSTCLGKGGKHPGLHLNAIGCGRIAANFISYNRNY